MESFCARTHPPSPKYNWFVFLSSSTAAQLRDIYVFLLRHRGGQGKRREVEEQLHSFFLVVSSVKCIRNVFVCIRFYDDNHLFIIAYKRRRSFAHCICTTESHRVQFDGIFEFETTQSVNKRVFKLKINFNANTSSTYCLLTPNGNRIERYLLFGA